MSLTHPPVQPEYYAMEMRIPTQPSTSDKCTTPTRLSREELYELVWSEPMRTLAPKFGLSDVGLAKTCRRMRIPVPSRGYWAKRAAGQPVRRARLPEVLSSAGLVNEFVAHRRPSSEQAPTTGDARGPAASKPARPPIPVAATLRNPHPDVARTANLFLTLKPGWKGLLGASDKGYLPLRIAPKTLPRALRIADAIRKECDVRGYSVTYGGVEYGNCVPRCRIMIEQDSVSWLLEEEFERVPHLATAAELLEKQKYPWKQIPAYDHHVVGNLALRILDVRCWQSEPRVRYSWVDGKRQRVEGCLSAFFDAVVQLAEIEKKRRLEREVRERERLEEQRLAREREERRRKEEARVKDLDAKLSAWVRSRNLHEFLSAVEAISPQRDIQSDSSLPEWIAWARAQADATDPLRNGSRFWHIGDV